MLKQNWIFNGYIDSTDDEKITDLANYIRLNPNLLESIGNIQLLQARLLLHESLKTRSSIECLVDFILDISKNTHGEFPHDFDCLNDMFREVYPFSRTVETNVLLVKNRIQSYIDDGKYLEEIDQARLYCNSSDPSANITRFIFDLNRMYITYSVNYEQG